MFTSESVNTFLAIVRTGSFVQAAEIVGTTQSTISHRVRLLEQQLGQTLILRTRGSRSIALTSAGETFLDIAQRWKFLEVETEQLKMSNERRLSVGAVDSVSIYVLPKFFGLLSTDIPSVRLHLETGNHWQLYARVASGHLHTAFTFNAPDHSDLITCKLRTYDMVVAVSAGTLDPRRRRVSMDELPLNQECYIRWSNEFDLWRTVRNRGHSANWIDKGHLLPPLLRRKGTWAIIPTFMAKTVKSYAQASIVNLDSSPPNLSLFMTRKKNDLSLRPSELSLIEKALALTVLT